MGYHTVATDYSLSVLKMAKGYFHKSNNIMNFANSDAFDISFKSKSFYLSFHNGFFICFNDDAIIRKLISEQIRVTSKMVVTTVHNKLNNNMINIFKEKAKSNKLYDVRFYYPEEIESLMKPYFKNIRIFPFGHPFHERLIKSKKRIIKNIYFQKLIYQLTCRRVDIKKCERLMCVGWL